MAYLCPPQTIKQKTEALFRPGKWKKIFLSAFCHKPQLSVVFYQVFYSIEIYRNDPTNFLPKSSFEPKKNSGPPLLWSHPSGPPRTAPSPTPGWMWSRWTGDDLPTQPFGVCCFWWEKKRHLLNNLKQRHL